VSRKFLHVLTEADKAQMLLGYLSREVRSDKDELGTEPKDSCEEVI